MGPEDLVLSLTRLRDLLRRGSEIILASGLRPKQKTAESSEAVRAIQVIISDTNIITNVIQVIMF